ncbi:hypothetical protein PIB30_052217 [Stylosanthes scabra]|uniref:Uncharacterized protein n=1 Tax=Stylosanthes scabra TaxID=79078 RepID=A0ABU6ZGW3_9FABA|nr:hypothetical protein [Stylosanthes scabra]
MTGVLLDLGEAKAGTSTPPPTSTPVVPTPSLSESLPAMRMIPTPGSRVQPSNKGTCSQIPTPAETPTQTATEDDEPPPPEPDPMPYPLVDNPLPEGEEEDIALEEELARKAGSVYLRWDGGNWIYESWRMRAAKRLREIMHGIRNKGAPHGWIRQDLWDRLVEFWRQEDFKKLKQVNKKNRASSTGGSLHTGGSTMYEATREDGVGAKTNTYTE